MVNRYFKRILKVRVSDNYYENKVHLTSPRPQEKLTILRSRLFIDYLFNIKIVNF